MDKDAKTEIKEVTPKCPGCGSQNLGLPENIEKRKDGIFLKGTDLQLWTLPDPAYVCLDCRREMSSEEVMRAVGFV